MGKIYKAMRESGLQTSAALILGFKDNIMHDMHIPDMLRVYDSVIFALSEVVRDSYPQLKGADPSQYEDMDYVRRNVRYKFREHSNYFLDALESRVVEGLSNALFTIIEGERVGDDFSYKRILGYAEDTLLCQKLFMRDDLFASEWFFGYGSLYRFRDGKREEVEKEVGSYFSAKELDNFSQMHEHMRIYIPKTYRL